ncbi:MAG: class A beta-lactamase [Woeseiaceae bacterium]|nr:class A beta-lactamase [Woeseiaceae bacterium]
MTHPRERSAPIRRLSFNANRRAVLKSLVAVLVPLYVSGCSSEDKSAEFEEAISNLELKSGGRLGVCVLGSLVGKPIGHRLNERFGMCSTFKLALAALILKESQEGRVDLESPVHYSQEDMVLHSPVTSMHLERGHMTVAELAEAAQKTSDNLAANLLLDLIGGPKGFTDKLREIGDTTTRLDRYEPEMNFVPVGEVRDTTTPLAMAATVRMLLAGALLSKENKQLIRTWMEETRTGLSRLRAGFPRNWRAGDKTGTGIADGMPNKYNDIAVVWPDDETSILVVTAYYDADGTYDEVRDKDVAVLKSVGQIVADALHTQEKRRSR